MKKMIIVLTIAGMMACTACGNSKPSRNTDDGIEEINVVPIRVNEISWGDNTTYWEDVEEETIITEHIIYENVIYEDIIVEGEG